MKAILMSIKPKWCEKIFNGEKTIEVRKTVPKLELPFKVYVYESIGQGEGAGAVVGEFVCDKVRAYIPFGLRGFELFPEWLKEMCLSKEQLDKYGGLKTLYGLHITTPKRYDTPKELGEFTPWCEKSRNTDDSLETCCNCKNAFFDEDGAFFGCGVTCPPQSWMYVEEIEECSD